MKKLLIIDDSEVNIYLIESIFSEDSSIEVIQESQSTMAFKTIQENKPDLILLDLMMPEIDGFDLLNEIRKDKDLNKTAVMVISAKTDEETVKRVTDMGVELFIKKPIVLAEIEHSIRDFFAGIKTAI